MCYLTTLPSKNVISPTEHQFDGYEYRYRYIEK